MPARLLRSLVSVALAAVSSALVLAGCGSAGESGSGAGSATASAGIKFADCMRSHGVPNFPDPIGSGGAFQFGGRGINPRSPAFQSAQSACDKLLPGKTGGTGGSEAHNEQIVRLAECMRAHGLTTFPDPTASVPSAPPSGGGHALATPGGSLVLPGSMIQSPAFKQAAAACGFRLPAGRKTSLAFGGTPAPSG